MWLHRNDLAVLEALEDGTWHTPSDISTPPPCLPIYTVRSSLRMLVGLGLARRGGGAGSGRWGKYILTADGNSEIQKRRQLQFGTEAAA